MLFTFVYVFLGQIDCNKQKKFLIINWVFKTQFKLSYLIPFPSGKKCLEKPLSWCHAVCEIRTFTCWAIFPEKQKSLLVKKSDPKISYGCGGHNNLCTLSGLCLFYNSNHMKLPLPDVFDKLIFLYAFSFSQKSVSSSHHRRNTPQVGVLNSLNQISSKWMLNPEQN